MVSKELIFIACIFFASMICAVNFGSVDNSLHTAAVTTKIDNSQNTVVITTAKLPHPAFYKDAIVIGAAGHDINLIDNKNAINVSYTQVIQFIQQDITDRTPYSIHNFMCGDYTEQVHNNAESSGIICGFVLVDLAGSKDHACNVFNTTDRGLVFIDCTGFDSTVDMIIGQMYQPHSLDGDGVDPIEKLEDYQITW